MESVHHLDLVVTSLETSVAFYQGVLGPLGYYRTSEITGERGERVVYLGGALDEGITQIGLRERQSQSHAIPYDRYAVGVHHIAFRANSRRRVDERAAWLREQGVEIESGPHDYDYAPGYYAVFFYDPDGLKLEIVHLPRDPDLHRRVEELEQRLRRLGE